MDTGVVVTLTLMVIPAGGRGGSDGGGATEEEEEEAADDDANGRTVSGRAVAGVRNGGSTHDDDVARDYGEEGRGAVNDR
jgi:hypothetical protein